MIQKKIIQELHHFLLKDESIEVALLIGSFGRNTPKANSDIDIQIIVNERFDKKMFVDELVKQFETDLVHHVYLIDKDKYTLYFTENYILVEIIICYKLSEINVLYLGSEINEPKNAIIFDKLGNLLDHLHAISSQKKQNAELTKRAKINRLLSAFQNYFESASSAHSKSDGYKFFVLYNHALNALIRLIYLYEGGEVHDYMPPNFLTDYGYRLNTGIEKLGTMDLRVATYHKRQLLDIFKTYFSLICNKFNLDIEQNKVITFLEGIYNRDYFWNLRDLNKFNKKVSKGVVFRSAALCLIKETEQLEVFLEGNKINTMIDLRADKELKEVNYPNSFSDKYTVIHAPFDPWNQSIEFKNTYNTGTNIEIAYNFFGRECKPSIKKVMEAIINAENAVAIHCHAGKDRTGIVITILHLLSNADLEIIMLDYLASEMDTTPQYITIFLDIVHSEGGVINYLKSCDLSLNQITKLTNKLCG